MNDNVKKRAERVRAAKNWAKSLEGKTTLVNASQAASEKTREMRRDASVSRNSLKHSYTL